MPRGTAITSATAMLPATSHSVTVSWSNSGGPIGDRLT
jgi:hypothetical protein